MEIKPTIEVKSCRSFGMVKCERCYHWSYSMLPDGICNTCAVLLEKFYPNHPASIAIRENLLIRGLAPKDNPKWY